MMRGAYITEIGPAENIRVGMLPTPTLGADTVLVGVKASAVNHVDTFVRSGAFRTPLPLPFIVGRDLIGVVIMPGGGFFAGQPVWSNSLGYQGRQGTCAEFAAVPAERLYALPSGINYREAIAVLHPATTALLGLQRQAKMAAGETVVVNGCGGAVGSSVCQIAAARGARVIAIDRPENSAWAEECGATGLIDRNSPVLVERLKRATSDGINIFWDTTGHPDLAMIMPFMARGGRIVLIAGLSSSCVLPIGELYTRDVTVRGFAISNATETELSAVAKDINVLLSERITRPPPIVAFGLNDVAAAHRAQERRRYPGRRLIVEVQDTVGPTL